MKEKFLPHYKKNVTLIEPKCSKEPKIYQVATDKIPQIKVNPTKKQKNIIDTLDDPLQPDHSHFAHRGFFSRQLEISKVGDQTVDGRISPLSHQEF